MRSRDRLRRRIIAGGIALVVAIAGAAAYDGWRLHEQLMSASERELGNLANALAAQTARSLQAVDVLLRDTSIWYETEGNRLDAGSIEAALASRVVGVSQTSVMSIVDANGKQRYRSRQTGEPLAEVSDRPYFLAHRDRTDVGMFVNEPVVTRTEGLPALVVSRRLNKPDGRFDGVVTAIVTVQQLQQMFASINLGKGSALLLTQEDGTLVMRQPPDEGLPGKQVKFRDLAALKGGELVDRAISPIDGRAKLVAVIGIGNQPLMLAVTRDEEEALRPWYDEMWSGAVRTVVMSLLVLLTMLALLRQLRGLELGEQALRESEERYAMAMEAANEGHGEWNIPNDSVFASDKWCALHGVDAAGLKTFADVTRAVVLHPDDLAPVRTAIDDHLAGRSAAIEIEYRVRTGMPALGGTDGPWRWIHARARCLKDEQGKPMRLFCAATDVSARKLGEAERARLETRLQQTQRLEALGTLAGGIAHDFNNILGAILGFGEMAQRQADSGQPIRRHIERVLQAGARARMLVRRILDFSRSGVAERVPVNIQGVVEEVVAMLTPTLPQGLSVATDLRTGNAAVLGDATQLYQVVMNLCTNAVRAMDESGLLELSSRRVDVDEARPLFQGDLRPGSYVCIQVADTGSGIAPDVKARIFDPFFTTREVGEGTGLGLSVVHGIVSDVGGAIDVADRAECGTLVSVWLPIGGESERVLPPIVSDWPRGNGEAVMIVDDEQALVELAEELLAGLGYEPVGYDSSEAALLAFEADPQRFDAVLSDEMLPGMTGSEFAFKVRALRPELPIVLMSGNVSAALEARARAAGVQAVLHKPLSLQELAECLSKFVGTKPRDLQEVVDART
jgi:PAS domain S-box-containing protein